jgi:hypothetical protein
MEIQFCEQDARVATAIITQRWTPDLAAHMETCPLCGETASVATRVKQLAGTTIAGIEVPMSARMVWLRMHYVRKQAKVSIVERIGLLGTILAVCLGIVWLLTWTWGGLPVSIVSPVPRPSLMVYAVPIVSALMWFLADEIFSQDP